MKGFTYLSLIVYHLMPSTAKEMMNFVTAKGMMNFVVDSLFQSAALSSF